jgi:ATP:ADP antiporter, AAA family
VIFRDQLGGVVAALGSTPLMLAVVFGTAQNIASKATKYSLFDPTKEMAYIPLDEESKVKGKAAIDVVGARFGKAGGALINQGLIIVLGGIGFIAPYVGAIMIFILGGWIIAARSLNKQFTALNAQREKEAAEALASASAEETAEETAKSPQPTS